MFFCQDCGVLWGWLKGLQERNRRDYVIPVPQGELEDWERFSDTLSQLGFVQEASMREFPDAVWPSPRRIYVHQTLEALAEISLWPNGIFLVVFTTLFPDGSVRTYAGEERLTISPLGYDDSVTWEPGSLVAVWQSHMNRVERYRTDYGVRPLEPTLETYVDFLNLVSSGLVKAGEKDRASPKTIEDHLVLGFVNLELRRKRKALGMFLEAARRDPGNASLWRLAGRMALVMHDYKAAVSSLRKSLDIPPGDPETFLLLADTLMLLNKKRQAFDTLSHAKRLFPEDRGISLALGEAAVDVGELGEGAANLEAVNDVEGASVELFTALGKLHRKLKDAQKSREYFRLARVFAREKKSPKKLPWTLD